MPLTWRTRAGGWIGVASTPAALVTGGGLAAQLPLATFLIAVPLGVVLLTALAVAQGVLAQRDRRPLSGQAASSFGTGSGARLFNATTALSMAGWFSFHVGLAGTALGSLTRLPLPVSAFAVAAGLWGISRLGLTRWNFLVWLTTTSVLLTALLTAWSVGGQLRLPAAGPFDLNGFFFGVGTMVAYGIVFATRSPDFTWELARPGEVIKTGFVFAGMLLAFLGIGAALYLAVGDWNVADVLARGGAGGLANVFLILSILGATLSSLHSGGLALSGALPVGQRAGAAAIALTGLLLGALRFDRLILEFLQALGAVFPPALVVMLVTGLRRRPVAPGLALLAWLSGAAASLLALASGLPYIVLGPAVSLAAVGLAYARGATTKEPAA